MKIWFKYFFYLSVLIFIPRVIFSQPDIKDSIAQKNRVRQGINWRTDTSASDSGRMSSETIILPEAKPSDPVKKKVMPFWLWIVIGFIPGFLAGCFLIFQYSKSNIYSILTNEKIKYLDRLKAGSSQNLLVRKWFKYLEIVALLKHSKDEKKRAVKNLTNDIAHLKKENEKLITEIEQKEKVIAAQIITADMQVSTAEHSERQSGRLSRLADNNSHIFFTIPESDGSFKASNGKDWQDIDCFYKIIPDKNDQKGKLYFISGDYDLRALDNIDYYLNPVCEIQNITDRSFAKRILMTDPGMVIKRGDCWEIEENYKVKIKLV